VVFCKLAANCWIYAVADSADLLLRAAIHPMKAIVSPGGKTWLFMAEKSGKLRLKSGQARPRPGLRAIINRRQALRLLLAAARGVGVDGQVTAPGD